MMQKLIINRNEWLRGEGGSRSKLHRVEDKQNCCIGICLRDLYSFSEYEMSDIPSVADIVIDKGDKVIPRLPSWMLPEGMDIKGIEAIEKMGLTVENIDSILEDFYAVNDYEEFGDDRERQLKKLFKDVADIEVEFVDSPIDSPSES
jgi:hypothetical protein